MTKNTSNVRRDGPAPVVAAASSRRSDVTWAKGLIDLYSRSGSFSAAALSAGGCVSGGGVTDVAEVAGVGAVPEAAAATVAVPAAGAAVAAAAVAAAAGARAGDGAGAVAATHILQNMNGRRPESVFP